MRAAIVALAAIAAACSRDSGPRTIEVKPRFDPGAVGATGARADASEPSAEALPLGLGAVSDASDFLAATIDAQAPKVWVAVPAPSAPVAPVTTPRAAPSPPPDPDAPLRERLRVDEGRCFGPTVSGAPSYFARVDVTVIPTGTVSRAEIAATDVTSAAVLDCLRSTARAATFSDNDGGPLRTYSIDVRVFAQ